MARLVIAFVLFVGSALADVFPSPEYLKYRAPSAGPTFLCRTVYAVVYKPPTKVTADWIMEHRTCVKLTGRVGRFDDVRPDPNLPTGQ